MPRVRQFVRKLDQHWLRLSWETSLPCRLCMASSTRLVTVTLGSPHQLLELFAAASRSRRISKAEPRCSIALSVVGSTSFATLGSPPRHACTVVGAVESKVLHERLVKGVSRNVQRGRVRHLVLTVGDELHDGDQEVHRVVVLAAWRTLRVAFRRVCKFGVFSLPTSCMSKLRLC